MIMVVYIIPSKQICAKHWIVLAFAASVPIQAGQSVTWLQQYLAIDAANPPDNGLRGVVFLAVILEAKDIPFETTESAPGGEKSGHTLSGGNNPALILLHHIDVVPADAKYWNLPPLSGKIRDDDIYGHGAIDTKGLGIAHLSPFLSLKDSCEKLNRVVIFITTVDEEAGGFYGAGWLLNAYPPNGGAMASSITEQYLLTDEDERQQQDQHSTTNS